MIDWLVAGPFSGIGITLLAYCVALGVYNLSGQSTLANPVLIGMAIVTAYLVITDTPYEWYFEGHKSSTFYWAPPP